MIRLSEPQFYKIVYLKMKGFVKNFVKQVKEGSDHDFKDYKQSFTQQRSITNNIDRCRLGPKFLNKSNLLMGLLFYLNLTLDWLAKPVTGNRIPYFEGDKCPRHVRLKRVFMK